jgi:hypothetical protein
MVSREDEVAKQWKACKHVQDIHPSIYPFPGNYSNQASAFVHGRLPSAKCGLSATQPVDCFVQQETCIYGWTYDIYGRLLLLSAYR